MINYSNYICINDDQEENKRMRDIEMETYELPKAKKESSIGALSRKKRKRELRIRQNLPKMASIVERVSLLE